MRFRDVFPLFWFLILITILSSTGRGEIMIRKKSLDPEKLLKENILSNPSFEEGEDTIKYWKSWKLGYEIDEKVALHGKRSVRCKSDDPQKEYGIFQTIILNQTKPIPIFVQGWSKAENVSEPSDSGYSIYVDIDFVDGSHLWGRTANFSCGTHDWERRSLWIFPEKPIAQLNIYGLFRWHTGTAWFDDFFIAQLSDIKLYDGVPIQSVPLKLSRSKKLLTITTPDGLKLVFDKSTGQLIGEADRPGGFYLRDVANNSDFHQPLGEMKQVGNTYLWEAQDEELGLRLSVKYTSQKIENGVSKGKGFVVVDGVIEDLTRKDRAVSLYFTIPINADGWFWSNDVRDEEVVQRGKTFFKAVDVPVGATGTMSLYPLACLSDNKNSLAMAIPLDEPRLYRIAYDPEEREFYIVFDFALVPDTEKFPSRAHFHFIIYKPDPAWRMRSALQMYYDIFPQFFTKRVKKEGIWMPFADIANVPGFEDFYFAFQEGAPNPAFDEEHGIYSFVYVEPASHWLSMPPEAPRTYEGAMQVLKDDLQGKRGEEARDMAIATLTSGIQGPEGKFFCFITKAPWCDGAVFLLNPDPDVPTTPELPLNKAKVMFRTIESAMSRQAIQTEGWSGYGLGYTVDEKEKHSGKSSILCEALESPKELGASQTIVLNQSEPKPLLVKAWSKAEGVSGEEDLNYAIYVDLYYTDGSPQWAINAPFSVGTHDWEEKELVINPQKPISTITVYLLFRRTHKGRVWFDDVYLGEIDRNVNLLKNPGFEGKIIKGEIDGTYLDSLEMGAKELNFRRDHFPSADIPLVFHRDTHQPCQMFMFLTYEFEKEIARRMHEQNKLLFANAVLWNFAFPAHLLDVLGTEVNWLHGDEYQPDNDAVMNFRRALCYRKPYCLLMNTNYEKFNHQLVEKYFKRCLFYAIFPGFFDEEAASKDPYWTSPKRWFERDRELFKKYLPLIISIARAGWEPLTFAISENKDIYVERYGRFTEGNLYFTVYNPTKRKEKFKIEIDLTSLGIKSKRITVKEILTGKEIPLQYANNQAVLEGELEAEDVWLLKVNPK